MPDKTCPSDPILVRTSRRALLPLLTLALTASALPAATFSSIDTITAGRRTNFNGFEAMTGVSGGLYPTNSYTEDGIIVTQINPDASPSLYAQSNGRTDNFGWYPDGGDNGYTQITRPLGLDFGDVGLLVWNGANFKPTDIGQHTIAYYELLDDGAVVLSGSFLQGYEYASTYISFLGGGFDTIRIRDAQSLSASVTDGTFNALGLDSIELAAASPVPLPASALAASAALAPLTLRRKR